MFCCNKACQVVKTRTIEPPTKSFSHSQSHIGIAKVTKSIVVHTLVISASRRDTDDHSKFSKEKNETGNLDSTLMFYKFLECRDRDF